MHADLSQEIRGFLTPEHLYSRQEVLVRPSPVPAVSGVYGWWFRQLPAPVDISGCYAHNGFTLLYVGISPRRPPVNGRSPSRQTLRTRVWTHYAGNAEGSTLRKTLGCLLSEQLGIHLRRVGSGHRKTFVGGEHALSTWMGENALVSWVVRERPWELEDELIARLDLPLNLEGNKRNQFHQVLTQTRARCVAEADALPVLPNPRTGGR